MGLDLYGAGRAASSLLGTDGVNQTCLPMNATKSVWNTQIMGLYSLLYPYIHTDYANRSELDMQFKLAFQTHDSTNMHFGEYSIPGNTTLMPTPLIPREKMFTTGMTPSKTTSLEKQTAATMETVNTKILVKADSPVVSYGV
jgi:hypothetical protein